LLDNMVIKRLIIEFECISMRIYEVSYRI